MLDNDRKVDCGNSFVLMPNIFDILCSPQLSVLLQPHGVSSSSKNI